MSQCSSRRAEKEAEWRAHLNRQASSGESIRGYCRRRGVSEASFHFWRREIAKRDQSARRTAGSGAAGWIAVDVVGDTSARSTAGTTLEIACPGGAVIRLREEVSLDVLERVLRACRQLQAEGMPVRSC